MRRSSHLAATLAVLLGVSACASRAARTEPVEQPQPEFAVQVVHNYPGVPSATIHLYEAIGLPYRLGRVYQGGTEVFAFGSPANGRIRLVAELPDGRRMTTRPFFLTRGGVRWSLYGNTVQQLVPGEMPADDDLTVGHAP